MGGEEGFKVGPCMEDILLFHDKVRSKKYIFFYKKEHEAEGERWKRSSEPGDVGGFWEVASDNGTTG